MSAVMHKGPWKEGESKIILRKRGGGVNSGNSGPAGRKMKPAARHYRALAEMAARYGVVNGKRKTKVKRAA
jgi:hypothetical protein